MIRVPVCQLCACRVPDYDQHYREVHRHRLEAERTCFHSH